MKEDIEIKKILANTLWTIIIIVAIIAAFVAINLLVHNEEFNDIDLTEKKIYSLSEESKDKLKDIEKAVTIYFFGMSNNEYETTISLAKQYSSINKNIQVNEINELTQRPDLVASYAIEENTQAIVVESGDLSKVISIDELFTYDYSTYETIDITEETLTNAILDVTIENRPKVYVLNNHLKYKIDYLSTVLGYLYNEANDVNVLDILVSGQVPEDTNLLIIPEIKEDLTEYEKEKIIEYINNGGNMMIMQGPNTTTEELTNFQQILELYGVSIEKGIVFEQDTNQMIYNMPELVIPTVSYGNSITQYISTDGGVCFIDSGIINFKTDEELEELKVTATKLLTLSDSAFLRTDLDINSMTKTDSDKAASESTIGAILEKQIESGDVSELILYSNYIFATDLPIDISSEYKIYAVDFYNNKDLVLNSAAYLTKRTDSITIRKETGTITFTATDKETKIIQIIITLYPLIIIAGGIIVWQVRRRKK